MKSSHLAAHPSSTAQVHGQPAQIGPNAIIRTVQALRETYGDAHTAKLLRQGGRADLIDTLPTTMVDEAEFHALVLLLYASIGPDAAQQILRRAGQLTAGYLLQHRIPQPVQWLLKILPDRLALRVLLSAISQHAWTFVGSGVFSFNLRTKPYVVIANCVECRDRVAAEPSCSFYCGAFEHLFRTLINAHTRVEETECAACGAERCVFQIKVR